MEAGLDRDEYADVWGDVTWGDGRGDLPLSETSVTEDSVPGEAICFQPKNEPILLPGVCGFLGSLVFWGEDRGNESIRRGGGLEGIRAIVFDRERFKNAPSS
jgi:hypothetical protein